MKSKGPKSQYIFDLFIMQKQSIIIVNFQEIGGGVKIIIPEDDIINMKFITYLLPFIIVAVVGEWMRKTKRNVETNDIINRFKELSINACFSRCKIDVKSSVFAMDKDIVMGQQAECVLLQNHAKQRVEGHGDVVELYVYWKVSVNICYSAAVKCVRCVRCVSLI